MEHQLDEAIMVFGLFDLRVEPGGAMELVTVPFARRTLVLLIGAVGGCRQGALKEGLARTLCGSASWRHGLSG